MTLIRLRLISGAAIAGLGAIYHAIYPKRSQGSPLNDIPGVPTHLVAQAQSVRRLPIAVTQSAAASGRAKKSGGKWKKTTASDYREHRFIAFASVEHDGIPYMTPKDFLKSVTRDQPTQSKKRRRIYSELELASILSKTPERRSGSFKLFREVNNAGIISYEEYLFLLCILAKARSGFECAFNMIKRTEDKSIDKDSFVLIMRMMSRQRAEFQTIDCSSAVPLHDTTLKLHLFGKSGTEQLNFSEFTKFMSNLQREVLEFEFMELSQGLEKICSSDFAEVLLRYTNLSHEIRETRKQNIRDIESPLEGISFEDFRLFFQFLCNLEDFFKALEMHSIAGLAINQDEFQHAVKACVGYTLSPQLVSTVFQVFDKNKDGRLDFHELDNILHDRMRRLGSRPLSLLTPTGKFKRCVASRRAERPLPD